MRYIVFIITLLVFIRTVSYSLWIKKEEKNTAGAICVGVISALLIAISLGYVMGYR